MMQNQSFIRRQNRDGSYDSICLSCFLTVTTVDDQASLAEAERTHVCGISRMDCCAEELAHWVSSS